MNEGRTFRSLFYRNKGINPIITMQVLDQEHPHSSNRGINAESRSRYAFVVIDLSHTSILYLSNPMHVNNRMI
jgi:hypothetical protein